MKPIVLRRLDRTDPRPFYRQIAAIVRSAIAARVYKAGERIPSVRDLATHFKVTALTVRAALSELVSEGLIEPRTGSGFYVLTNDVATDPAGLVVSPLDRKLRRLLHYLAALPLTPLDKLPQLLAQLTAVAHEIQDDLPPPHERHA